MMNSDRSWTTNRPTKQAGNDNIIFYDFQNYTCNPSLVDPTSPYIAIIWVFAGLAAGVCVTLCGLKAKNLLKQKKYGRDIKIQHEDLIKYHTDYVSDYESVVSLDGNSPYHTYQSVPDKKVDSLYNDTYSSKQACEIYINADRAQVPSPETEYLCASTSRRCKSALTSSRADPATHHGYSKEERISSYTLSIPDCPWNRSQETSGFDHAGHSIDDNSSGYIIPLTPGSSIASKLSLRSSGLDENLPVALQFTSDIERSSQHDVTDIL